MIDVKHESRYNYTELLHLIEEAFYGAFSSIAADIAAKAGR